MLLEKITSTLSESQVRADIELVTQIQINLRALGLYPGGKFIDGDFGPRSRDGVSKFCHALGLPFPQYDRIFATSLLNCQYLPELLNQSHDGKIYDHLLNIGKSTRLSSNEDGAFLHRGIENSKYLQEIDEYPQRLASKFANNIDLTNSYAPYPSVGLMPEIRTQSLDFLNPTITEACVCLGQFIDGEIQASWLGKNATNKVQFWSATKIIPLLYTVCAANSKYPHIDIENCYINNSNYRLMDLAVDMVTYRHQIASSNRIAAMFKQFQTPQGLEDWLKNITGNQNLEFRSGYGESPWQPQPQLFDGRTGKLILSAPGSILESDRNYISAYDLTRLISMLAWHLHIPQHARLPGGQWHSLSNLIPILGCDRARYIEVAIETLGLEKVLISPVIISKLGNGYSQTRHQNEITYVGYVQFLDTRNHGETERWRSLAMTLRGTSPAGRWVELDAAMATAVTTILRRVILEKII